METGNIIQITTTGDNKELMEQIGRHIVEKRLAACAQITGPIKSIYWWKGRMEETMEWACLLKTQKGLFQQVESAIKGLHSYDVPEIIAVPVDYTSPEYATWVIDETVQG